MANVLDLRRRIRSVKNTRQITKAMKMVSAAKLRKAQDRAMRARPYAQMLANVLVSLVRRTSAGEVDGVQTGEVLHPLLVAREEKNVLVIVIAGDKGFAGAFNSNIAKTAQRFIDERRALGQTIDLEPVGKKAIALYKKHFPAAQYESVESASEGLPPTQNESTRRRVQPIEVAVEHPGLLLRVDIEEVSRVAHNVIERFERAEIDSVYLVYNEFKSVIAQRLVVEKLLPVRKLGSQEITAAEEMSDEQREAAARAAQSSGISVFASDEDEAQVEAKKFGTADVEYTYDQEPEHIFNNLMPQYVTTQIYHALLESAAAEHAARMTATDAASKNAGDLIDSLSLTMNRLRQAAITTEIIEIVSGAAAL
jgi:F-type H+-transporting ATPase subunit gamma